MDTHMIELAADHPERLTPYVKSDGGLFGFGASVTISPEALIRSGPEATRGLGTDASTSRSARTYYHGTGA